MALIACADCGREVSSEASACPQCGRRIGSQGVELTEKRWKALTAIGAVLLFCGIISVTVSFEACLVVTGLSVVVLVTARLGAWWTRG